jgi:hypothetical protein
MASLSETLHTITLPQFSKSGAAVTVREPAPQDFEKIAQSFLAQFADALATGEANNVAKLIHEDGWWRDHLALSFDYHTLRSLPTIINFLKPILPQSGFKNFSVQESGKFAPHKEVPIEGLEWIEFMFHFETALGTGKGMLRLVSVPNGAWKAHMIYTALTGLHGFEEIDGSNRAHGGNNSLKGGAIEGNWFERRQVKKEFLVEEPTVLVIGAGQGGLNMGARLQALGLSCLIIDKNERVGDNWRHRYRTLVTHDPVQYTHLVRSDA